MFARDFEEFWKAYPRKVGKLAAQKAYERARKTQRATQAELLDGIRRYVAGKPDYADYCHPSTWLNQGRWMDEYGKAASPVKAKPGLTGPIPASKRADYDRDVIR